MSLQESSHQRPVTFRVIPLLTWFFLVSGFLAAMPGIMPGCRAEAPDPSDQEPLFRAQPAEEPDARPDAQDGRSKADERDPSTGTEKRPTVGTNTVKYTYGAKFEPPEGRILHGMGQFEPGNHAYLRVLRSEGLFPLSSLVFVPLGGQTRPWGRTVDSVRSYVARTHEQGMVPHVSIQLFGVRNLENDGDRGQRFGIDDVIANSDSLDDRIMDLVYLVKRDGRPLFFRIGGEFNGPWNKYHPYDYPAAFRKIVKMFRDKDVKNAAFVWCYFPMVESDDFDHRNAKGEYKWYPGDDVVDWFAIDLFSAGAFMPVPPTRQVSGPTAYTRTLRFLKMAAAHQKPVMIPESSASLVGAASRGGSADQIWNAWFKPYFSFIHAHPGIKAFYYINTDWSAVPRYRESGWQDARIETIPALAELYRRAIQKGNYLRRDEIHLLNDYGSYQSPSAQRTRER